ncbi:Uncharacterized protein PCOAH_00036000 [Plasmodium coatneyi]|uniref:PIR Superfamily Protein n=1 Tax=Plasmodium coatneyi TaxID=208452 RepID=A0A1B1E1U5_9APIC|nr:Uncharacterized protein PCOAH_00036000 [Plasmodium coatneyi]ANQ09004.1 Uncharacterized protein PCOAH_00036000 [Plasmodium coatneyi]
MATGPNGAANGSTKTHEMRLPSKVIYDKLESNDFDVNTEYKECDNIALNGANEGKLKEICNKSLTFIKTSALWDLEEDGYDVCLQVNYWLYDILTGIYGSDGTVNIEDTFRKIQHALGENMKTKEVKHNNEKCKLDFNIFKEAYWKKRRELYEYYVDHKYLKFMATDYEDLNKCTYYNKIKEKQELFNYFHLLCEHGQNKYRKFCTDVKSHNPALILPTLPCHSKMGQAHWLFGNSETGMQVTLGTLRVAAIFLIAALLYRYTPVGPWIREHLRGRTNRRRRAMDEVSLYTEETDSIFSDDTSSYISYQSL